MCTYLIFDKEMAGNLRVRQTSDKEIIDRRTTVDAHQVVMMSLPTDRRAGTVRENTTADGLALVFATKKTDRSKYGQSNHFITNFIDCGSRDNLCHREQKS